MNWESEQILRTPNENFKDSSLTKEHKENKTNKKNKARRPLILYLSDNLNIITKSI